MKRIKSNTGNKAPVRVAITGTRGRWAGPLAEILEAHGFRVDRYSRSAGPGIRNLRQLQGRTARTYDAILSMAWPNVPSSCVKKRALPLAGIKKILSSLSRGSPPKTLFVLFSTCAVYGETRPSCPATERSRCRPKGHYAAQKLVAERLVESVAKRHKIPWCILRISNLFGIQHPTSVPQGVIPRLIESARTGKTMVLWGNGRAYKDYLHYRDLGRALVKIIGGKVRGRFNACAARSFSLLDLFQKVERLLGTSLKTQPQMPKPWDVQQAFLSHAKLRKAIRWTPQTSLDQGLKEMIRKYRGRPNSSFR